MRGEGFNPEIAKEAGRESAAKEIGRRESSFLDSLRQGAERHKLALAFLFSGALAESMSGTARAQEFESPSVEKTLDLADAMEAKAIEELEPRIKELNVTFDNSRAPYVYIEGYDERYRAQGSRVIRSEQTPDGEVEKVGEVPPDRVKANDMRGLQDKRLMVTFSSAMMDTRVIKSMQSDKGEILPVPVLGEAFLAVRNLVTGQGEASKRGVALHRMKYETAIYAGDGVDNGIEGAQAFNVTGWGETEDEAVANALREAGIYLGVRVFSDRKLYDSRVTNSGKNASGDYWKHGAAASALVVFNSEVGAAFIEGFSIVKTEKTPDGFVVNIEGLGNSVTMEPVSADNE